VKTSPPHAQPPPVIEKKNPPKPPSRPVPAPKPRQPVKSPPQHPTQQFLPNAKAGITR